MTQSTFVALNPSMEVAKMGLIRSYIPEKIKSRPMTRQKFIGECVGFGLDIKTANKLADGGTNVDLRTLAIVRIILNADSISELVDFDDGPDGFDSSQ